MRSVVIFDVVAVANIESTVGILIVDVAAARFIGPEIGLIHGAIPVNPFHAHGGVVEAEEFEFAIFVSCRENQVTVVQPLQSVGCGVLWLGIEHGIVPSSVL